MKRFCAALALVALCSGPALADVESWNWLELRMPLAKHAAYAPNSLRFYTGGRWGFRYPGLGEQFFRIGPIWEISPRLSLATHLTSYAQQSKPGLFDQEYRLEAEPTLRWTRGDLRLSNRHRLEGRWHPSGLSWRYRVQLKVGLEPKEQVLWPTISDEVLVEKTGMTQNRLALGFGRVLNSSTRLDTSYILRTRNATTWETDHILNLSLFFAPSLAQTGAE